MMPSPEDRLAASSPEDAVNAYLIQHYEVCLEEVIAEGVEGRVRPAIVAAVQVEARRLDHWRDEDGAVAELYEGMLTLEGVRYSWRASMFTDLDGDRFMASLGEFTPVDWRAKLRLVQ
jgi:hypothetical protein